jgi:amino acid transporter
MVHFTSTLCDLLILHGTSPLAFFKRVVSNVLQRGFAMGWDYAIQWLTILPFEITAAGITIEYWHTYNIGVRATKHECSQ